LLAEDTQQALNSPWQNAHAEKLIGSIRRECVVLGEAHLRRILRSYTRDYSEIRTHGSLNKDAPSSPAVQGSGVFRSLAILGGLHHNYVRISFSIQTTSKSQNRARYVSEG